VSTVTFEEALGRAIKLSHEHNTPFDVMAQTPPGQFVFVQQAEVPKWEDGGWKTLASVSYQSYAVGVDARRCANFIVRDYTAFGPSTAAYTKEEAA
jgi:hypothetical protein